MCLANNKKRKTTKNGKNRTTKSRKNQNARRKGSLQIFGNIGSGNHQPSVDERKNKKESLGKTREQLETKLHSRNLIKGINIWAVPIVRYPGPFLKWTREDLQQMDQRTRKLMTMYKASHLRNDIDRLYVSRKERRGLVSIQENDTTMRKLHKKRRGGRLITITRNNTDNTSINRTKITRTQEWEEKQLRGHFKWQTSEISHDKIGS